MVLTRQYSTAPFHAFESYPGLVRYARYRSSVYSLNIISKQIGRTNRQWAWPAVGNCTFECPFPLPCLRRYLYQRRTFHTCSTRFETGFQKWTHHLAFPALWLPLNFSPIYVHLAFPRLAWRAFNLHRNIISFTLFPQDPVISNTN